MKGGSRRSRGGIVLQISEMAGGRMFPSLTRFLARDWVRNTARVCDGKLDA